jgi:hypothetical protein
MFYRWVEPRIAIIVNEMKWALSLLCGLCFSFGPGRAGAAELTEGRTVYLLPMGHSLDQFIADRLTRMHVFHVVTDPAKADTIITDRVGASLESRLKELYPPPPPPEAKEAAKVAAKEAAKTNAEAPKPGGDVLPPVSGPLDAFGDTSNKLAQAGSMGTSGHGRGTIFLVDVKSSQVLWSIFETPRNNSPRELDRTAERIVKRLKLDLTPK